jgi:gas vesicle protein
MNDRMDDRTFYAATCLSFVAGALAGGAVACLLAPASGRETRDRLTRRLNESATSARDTRDMLLRKGAEAIRAASRKGEEAAQGIVSGLKPLTERTS